MEPFSRAAAVDRLEGIVAAVEEAPLPVPVREVWAYGDVALGLDPVERLDVYVTKELLYGTDEAAESAFRESHSIDGVGTTVSAEWARRNPDAVRAGPGGHAAPERCLAAALLDSDEPVHLEVCNAGFETNVRRRLESARAREAYERALDPRGVCLYAEGVRSEDALERLRAGDLVFPTLAEAFEMLGLDAEEARAAAEAVRSYRERQAGRSVRGEVV